MYVVVESRRSEVGGGGGGRRRGVRSENWVQNVEMGAGSSTTQGDLLFLVFPAANRNTGKPQAKTFRPNKARVDAAQKLEISTSKHQPLA